MLRKNHFAVFFFLLFFLLTLFLFWQRFQIGQQRYFDPDEFQYLNWSYHILTGYRPYVDFMMYITPGFPVFIAIAFAFGKGMIPFFVGRAIAFALFATLASLMGLYFYLLRRSWVAILVPLFLAVLPLPSDKFMEIRPGTLMTLLVMAGTLGQIIWIKRGGRFLAFVSGSLYCLAVIVSQQALASLLVAILLAFYAQVRIKRQWQLMFFFLVGVGTPLIILVLWLASFGNWERVIYSLVKLPFEVVGASEVIAVPPLWYFFIGETPVYFGRGGVSPGMIVNLALWFLGSCVAISRFGWLLYRGVKDRSANYFSELLFLGIFVAQGLTYIFLTSVHHTQYLIPVSVFIAFYLADLVYRIILRVKGGFAKAGLSVGLLALAGSFLWIYFDVHGIKYIVIVDRGQLREVEEFQRIVPKDNYVLDLEGASLYYPYPYFACCFRLGRISRGLSRPLPSLPQALMETQTKYIYQSNRLITTLDPGDQEFILQYYYPISSGYFWRSKYW
ncbi:MAG: hypothetical protein UW86_C0026G0005 [Microgenomates group bacterium GW2011_GWA1_Microgenomates_45_10]|nr:MAG: hypothetical protein UW69_C0015G0023 [Microgenomates group bacterium GW2011_GWA2_44_7]KKT77905.1 MAG: hypothetical protein UW73_C0009G0004 [Microgenomates group bacterium GW2011_GWB1_44_8]KKT86641.1 MAG: hypothetical protein UW86_C0026G0005 [Microgenomates group bacterium GW2011_GWA1_Microgenomates_45_10]